MYTISESRKLVP